jgi:hypothetical protein
LGFLRSRIVVLSSAIFLLRPRLSVFISFLNPDPLLSVLLSLPSPSPILTMLLHLLKRETFSISFESEISHRCYSSCFHQSWADPLSYRLDTSSSHSWRLIVSFPLNSSPGS